MPRYDFECSTCGHVEEFFAPSCEDLKLCPKCESQMKGLIPRASFHNAASMMAFRGTGRHGAWLNEPETQRQLKTGELEVATKSHDVMQQE